MNGRHNVAMVGGAGMLLASAPLALIFAGLFVWFLPIVFAVAVVVATGIGLRTVRMPAPVTVLGQVLALGLFLTWTSAGDGAVLGVVPTGATVENFGTLVGDAAAAASNRSIPVSDAPSLVFVSVLGVGLMAILVDLLAVGLRTPALAGLPMLAIYAVPMAVMKDTVPWLMFVPGALGYLWLLMTDNIQRVRRFGRRFTGDGRTVDVWEPSPLASTGRWLTLAGVIAALALPVVVPVDAAGLLDSFGTAGSGPGDGSGNGARRLDPTLNLRGNLDRDETIPMATVRTDDPNPGYLRMYVTDVATEDGFTQAPRGSDAHSVADGIGLQAMPPEVSVGSYTAEVTMQRMEDSVLPLYAGTTGVDADSAWIYDPATATVTSDSRNTSGITYTFTFNHYQFTPDLLRTAAPTPRGTEFYERNVSVPSIDSVHQLATSLTSGEATVYDKVLAINDHFSTDNGFSYKLATDVGSAPSAIEDFLKNKKGFCEQYAAAMTWLLREAGIPARPVLGFTRGSLVQGVWNLTNFNWHAWVEVYFEGFGWVPFDPTPSGNVRNPVDTAWAPDPSRVEDGVDGDPGDPENQPVHPGQDPSHPGLDPNDPRLGTVGSNGGQLTAAEPPVWPYVLLALLVVLLLLAQPALWRAARRSARLRAAPAGDGPAVRDGPDGGVAGGGAVHRAWAELQDVLIDYGFQGAASETPRGTAARLRRSPRLAGPADQGMTYLAGVEERARYAAAPPPREDLSGAVNAVRRELAGHTTAGRRLWILIAPPSLLGSWRRRASRSVAGVMNAAARARGRVTRSLSPRRRREGVS